MGLFSKMKEATYSKSSVFLTPNHSYTLKVIRAEVGSKFTGDEFFVTNFEVLESSAPEHKIGSEVSYLIPNFGAGKTMFLGNVKKVIVSICGSLAGSEVDPADVGEQDVLDILKPGPNSTEAGTMAAGVVVTCKTKGIITKGAGKHFTIHDFQPVFA